MYSISQIASVIHVQAELANPQLQIEHLLTDSRRLLLPATTLFFALTTARKQGVAYVEELYNKGVRSFVVPHTVEGNFDEANIIVVNDPLRALQQLAAWHRGQYHIPVIGITGSNGKTMVKEWLYQLLQPDYSIVRSPKSYNSQIGVPLSVWQMNSEHTLAIFEAGISKPGEMEHLQPIIQPTIGVLTNIGDAHNEGFASNNAKAIEKGKLFTGCRQIIYDTDGTFSLVANEQKLFNNQPELYTWSRTQNTWLTIANEHIEQQKTTIQAFVAGNELLQSITIPFTDKPSIDNAITCWCVLLAMGVAQPVIEQRMNLLQVVDMRMQVINGVNNCRIINDSYNNDLSSFGFALDYLKQQAEGKSATVILSDILQSGLQASQLFNAISDKAEARGVSRLILIGPLLFTQQQIPLPKAGIQLSFYPSTDSFLFNASISQFKDEVILIKGARVFEFERISHWLEEKVHQTVMEVNLTAMVHNLNIFQQSLRPQTKLMAMVKAFSYGSGSAEVARLLAFHKVDYLAVAYADEGVELRKAGITMPIMVMSPEASTFYALVDYKLEPELYSFNMLHTIDQFLKKQQVSQFPVHLKLDTGMHRLGFETRDVQQLAAFVAKNNSLRIVTVFSHLVASEDEVHDAFTLKQAQVFEQNCAHLQQQLGYSFIRHLANSAGIIRHPHLQYDMVRLGIGLYGVASTATRHFDLQTVVNLKSTIAQVRKVKAGETVGYGRRGLMQVDSVVATIRMGYADGLPRLLGSGVGSVWVKGKLAPVIGSVCMDMTMIDVTDIPGVAEGDEVELFGSHLPVTQVAAWCNTIAYEILTGISQRVKRVYYEE